MRTYKCIFAVITVLASVEVVYAHSPFAVEVIDYSQAPGQDVNTEEFNDPQGAIGAPSGGGLFLSNDFSIVTVGGFGGSITLKFDHTVMDHPTNPMGLDAIVFGNSYAIAGMLSRRWAECGVIEISRDVNGNGLADDPWYVIKGSHITDLTGQYETQIWDDDIEDETYPPLAPTPGTDPDWIPAGMTGQWATSGYRLPSEVFDVTVLANPNGDSAEEEGIWGYADYTPTLILGDMDADNLVDDPIITPEKFYTVPDDPFVVGITPGSAGGDAFDIAWAVDPATGQSANLDGFDFIRITNGVNFIAGPFGELSPEIDGVADVMPGKADMNCDGIIDVFDIDPFVTALVDVPAYDAAFPQCRADNADVNEDGIVDVFDIDAFVAVLVGIE